MLVACPISTSWHVMYGMASSPILTSTAGVKIAWSEDTLMVAITPAIYACRQALCCKPSLPLGETACLK